MLRILIAPDKFKGSLSSFEVCEAIEEGLREAREPVFEIERLPLADGGDGLLEIIRYYMDAQLRYAKVRDPLSRTIEASWLLSADGRTAFIEMARASGLQLLDPSEYDVLAASTYGTGQLIGEAIRSGAKEIVIGIGGSATNDGGMGMAAALGVRFMDAEGKELQPSGECLGRIEKIDLSGMNETKKSLEEDRLERLELMKNEPGKGKLEKIGAGADTGTLVGVGWPGIRFRVACDVQNPLCGMQGATRVYAPQKGADAEMVGRLETGMQHYAAVLKKELGIALTNRAGAGAAGGLGAGCMAFLNAEMVSGVDLVMEYSKARQKVQEADVIITGEGKMDRQTLQGKLVAGIAAMGGEYQKPVLALCGMLALSTGELQELGVRAAFPIMDGSMSLEESMRDAKKLLVKAAGRVGKLLRSNEKGY